MERRIDVRLADIADAIAGIEKTVTSVTFETFQVDWQVGRAVERGLEIISEASRRIPDEVKQREAEIPWRQIADIGNVLRHDYQRINPKIVWNIVHEYLPPLKSAVRRLRGEPGA